jgi:hypothetical protein
VAALGARSGVPGVTIYWRWRTADNLLLEAGVRGVKRRLPLTPSGNLQRGLTRWSQNAERGPATPRGQRLLAGHEDPSGPAAEITVPDDVLEPIDQIVAPGVTFNRSAVSSWVRTALSALMRLLRSASRLTAARSRRRQAAR